MRERERDDLPGVRRVSQDFFIAGHGGVEADFADGGAFGAEAEAFKDDAAGQNQQRGRLARFPGARHGAGGLR